MEGFVKHGCWICIDPDLPGVELIEENINLDRLCELIRCEATDLLPLGGEYLGLVDGEGAWQERQTEWEFDGKPCWGPMLIFKMGTDDLDMISCDEEDLNVIERLVRFLEHSENSAIDELLQPKRMHTR